MPILRAMADGPPILGVLLAGGGARRMGGGDKCLQQLCGRPLLAHVIERLSGQVDEQVLNANGAAERFAAFGLPVVADTIPGMAGPLAGILAGMEWARANRSATVMILSAPTDGPFLPLDLVSRLAAAKGAAQIACARSNGRTHPPIALWDVALADDLRRAMVDEEMRKIDRWTSRYQMVHVDWPSEPIDPFFNANRPEDLELATELAAGLPA
ncbi:MAG: molybdenum cofactor guanylyltransferase MobA [Alphaproteobacteria bacterium]|jgi:molybdopterin-guanine dinucleotide biosynthesis protein A|nr:molybdenum cofactor guanylyltransferase MobA [Alphaproteobacteria bacterium]MDP6832850.1 molybdenum cofactor guanylyltransferase MobA [Alphaproteobacteria bacterium]